MPLPLPGSLTPSKVTSFRECALAFRLSVIDKIPQPGNVWTLRGTLAHRVLDRFYYEVPQGSRCMDKAHSLFGEVWEEFQSRKDFMTLTTPMPSKDVAELKSSTWKMVEHDFYAEDPNSVRVIGTELMLETSLQGVVLRGIIDRLDLNQDGSLTVTDYKTGRMPTEMKEQDKLIGVYFYALLCEAVLGVRPATVQLIYLKDSTTIVAHPTEQSIRALKVKTGAIWKAVEYACQREDFRPRPSRLCGFCHYQSLCPASPMANALKSDTPRE